MNKEIILRNRNRDGAKIWLEQVENNLYTIKTDKDFVLEYTSINYDEVDPKECPDYDEEFIIPKTGKKVYAKIASFDPAGGPYINIGYKIDETHEIIRIFNNNKYKKWLFEVK